MTELTDTFRALHTSGTFLMPNPWDLGSARYLQWRGFQALATTSSGFAATLGRADMRVTRDELLGHVELICSGISIPLNVDSERCYADDLAGVAATVRLLAEAGAAGCSIEDYDPATGQIDELSLSVERVAAAATEAAAHGLVLTARAERHLHGGVGIDETIERLVAFGQAGAEVLYAPGLSEPADIEAVVEAVGAPLNVLVTPKTPPLADLEGIGVRRISTGGALAWAALGGLKVAVDELIDGPAPTPNGPAWAPLSAAERAAVFGDG